MLRIEKNKDLTPYTTIKIAGLAEFFVIVRDKGDFLEALGWAKEKSLPIFILGGGSNVLISKKIKGLVIKNELRGIDVAKQDDDYIFLEGLSGESWMRFVDFAVSRGWHGLENLFAIYGTVGAAPMQNIGAYGVELKDVFHHLKAIDLRTGHEKIFSLKDCRFGYRDSIFKRRLKGRYFIYSVTVKLSRRPNFSLDYGALRDALKQKGVFNPDVRDVARAVAEIRASKLPTPSLLPNAGSFFKNVSVSKAQYRLLQKKYPDIPSFPLNRQRVKIPAAWLIERAGFKGKRFATVSMYEKQALILVNHGGASAKQAIGLVKRVVAGVKKKFGLDLEPEVNII